MIDLRSDTVTKPTPAMRRAMAEAEVGDDVYGEDPTVNRLQERAAELFGKEAAIFVPTGSMGNQIAVKLHTRPGNEVVIEERGHIFNYEMAAMSAVAGTVARPVRSADGSGILRWEEIASGLHVNSHYYVAPTGLVAIENSHNLAGGTVYTRARTEEVCERAHATGLPVHLDGARIFNAAAAQNETVAALARPADSVMFCLSKALGAPVGSMLLGTREFIEEARANIVIFDVAGTGIAADAVCARLAERQVLASGFGTSIRMVTHYDVSREGVETALAALREVIQKRP
ncbi:MAG: low specificity L-threonine aldolase [Acidobacteria bacterium]|nr:low specificity L-threonine aldolase [Acidobacteriota bacterium]